MPALTPQVLYDLETNMQAITEEEYGALIRSLWWSKVMKVRPSASKKEIIAWLLSTAMIEPAGKGGSMNFADMVAVSTEYELERANNGLKLLKDQLEDNDGQGFAFAAKWAADMGVYMAYWPQKQCVKAILNGETGKGYDKIAFFSGWDAVAHTGLHPYNPYKTALGGYANVFTGSSDVGSGYSYPGACRIDDGVTLDTAVINLSKAFAYIGSIKQANGEDPRFLRPRGLLVPPRMTARAAQLTKAKFIAQAASSGGGSGDIEAIIAEWGQLPPTEVTEFGGNYTYTMPDGTQVSGDDSTAYLYVDEITSRQLGGLVYVDRSPFAITYYTGAGGGGVDAFLDRANELEWHVQGRNTTGYGHPYLLFKLKAS
jgi:hypothetical protein